MKKIDATPSKDGRELYGCVDGGYTQDFARSARAEVALEAGAYPASVIEKELKLPSGFVDAHFFTKEWHHTGKYYNKTAFYSLDTIRDAVRWDEEIKAALAAAKDAAKAAKKAAKEWHPESYNARVEWMEYYRSRGRWIPDPQKYEGEITEYKSYVILKDGRKKMKKAIDLERLD